MGQLEMKRSSCGAEFTGDNPDRHHQHHTLLTNTLFLFFHLSSKRLCPTTLVLFWKENKDKKLFEPFWQQSSLTVYNFTSCFLFCHFSILISTLSFHLSPFAITPSTFASFHSLNMTSSCFPFPLKTAAPNMLMLPSSLTNQTSL